MDRTKFISEKDLDSHPDWIFVFGDNLIRRGYGGAAKLRDHTQSYGFITKKYPDWKDTSFYTPEEYRPIFEQELAKLVKMIQDNPTKMFIVSKLGSNLANKFGIYEAIIRDRLLELKEAYGNVVLMEV